MDWQDLARRQSGVISRRQLVQCGLSRDRIDGLICRGAVRELLPGVYSPRALPESAGQKDWAAVLWSGGVLSHHSAARLWEIPTSVGVMTHVTVSDRRFRGQAPGIRLHRVHLDGVDCTSAGGLPISTRPRTVLDLMRTERYAIARDLRDRAIQQGWLDESLIIRSVGAQLGRTGNVQLRRLVAELERGAQAESERLLHAILRRSGIRGWTPQHRVQVGTRTFYVDVAFAKHRLALEVDGRRHHGDQSDRFEDDRQRQNVLISAGWRVLRFTWAMLNEHPNDVLATIVQLLPPSGR